MKAAAPRWRHALPPVYATAALRLAFPLLVLPVMARRLGADEFGRLGWFLAWAGLLAMLVEGGFLAAATRHAVRADVAARWVLARQVASARGVLAAAALGLSLAVVALLAPGADTAGTLAQAALLGALAVALGAPATWYLQASQQLHRWAWVEGAVTAAWLVAALALAHSVAAYLLLQLAATATLALAGWAWLWRDLHGAAPAGARRLFDRAACGPGLRLGAAMLPVSLAGAAYSHALPAVASAALPRAELGLVVLADRVVRAVLAAADPLLQLVYPRIVARLAAGEGAAWRYAARWALAGTAAGAVAWAAAALGWPWLKGWLAGAAPDAAALRSTLLTLALLWPLLWGWKFLGSAMLGSARYDTAYRACVLVGGAVGVAGAALLGATGSGSAPALARVALAAELAVIAAALAGIALTRRAAGRPAA